MKKQYMWGTFVSFHLFYKVPWICVCVRAQLCPALCDPMDCSPPDFCPWNFPGKHTGVGCHFLLQGIFLIQGLNPGLPHCRQILYKWQKWESKTGLSEFKTWSLFPNLCSWYNLCSWQHTLHHQPNPFLCPTEIREPGCYSVDFKIKTSSITFWLWITGENIKLSETQFPHLYNVNISAYLFSYFLN